MYGILYFDEETAAWWIERRGSYYYIERWPSAKFYKISDENRRVTFDFEHVVSNGLIDGERIVNIKFVEYE